MKKRLLATTGRTGRSSCKTRSVWVGERESGRVVARETMRCGPQHLVQPAPHRTAPHIRTSAHAHPTRAQLEESVRRSLSKLSREVSEADKLIGVWSRKPTTISVALSRGRDTYLFTQYQTFLF